MPPTPCAQPVSRNLSLPVNNASAALLVALSADEGHLVPRPSTVVRNTPHRACRVAFWHVSREKVSRHHGRSGLSHVGGSDTTGCRPCTCMLSALPSRACLEAASPRGQTTFTGRQIIERYWMGSKPTPADCRYINLFRLLFNPYATPVAITPGQAALPD